MSRVASIVLLAAAVGIVLALVMGGGHAVSATIELRTRAPSQNVC